MRLYCHDANCGHTVDHLEAPDPDHPAASDHDLRAYPPHPKCQRCDGDGEYDASACGCCRDIQWCKLCDGTGYADRQADEDFTRVWAAQLAKEHLAALETIRDLQGRLGQMGDCYDPR